MKTKIPISLFLLFSLGMLFKASGQTTLYSENFNTGSSTTWSLNTADNGSLTDTSVNYWLINNVYTGDEVTTPAQPSGITGSPNSYYMHISNAANNSDFLEDYDASFLAPASGNFFAKMNKAVSTTGYANVTFSFWYLCNGGNLNGYYGNLYYSVNGGTTWILKGKYNGVTAWSQANVTDSAFNNQADLRFAFQWVQTNSSTATDPPWAVDDISITGTSCAAKAVITANGPTTFCKGSDVKLTATAGASYRWSTGQTTRAITSRASGSYDVTVTKSPGCSAVSKATVVTVEPLPTFTIKVAGTVCNGGTETLTATKNAAYTYLWSNGATTNVIKVTSPGTYAVDVSNATCNASKSEFIPICAGPVGQIAGKTGDETGNEDVPVSLSELQTTVYPNPYTGSFHLKMVSAKTDNVNIRVYDVNGKLIEEKPNLAYNTDVVLGSSYTTGVYIVRVQQGEMTQQTRIVKID